MIGSISGRALLFAWACFPNAGRLPNAGAVPNSWPASNACGVPSASSGARIAVAEIEITGPFDGAVLETHGRGETRIDGHLLAAESRRLRVPVCVSSIGSRIEPRIRLDSTAGELDAARGRLRFVGWRGGDESPLDAVPAGLRARTRPPLAAAEPEAGGAGLAWLAASFVCGLALLRKPRAAVVLGVVSALAVFLLGPRARDASPQRVTVEDGDAQSSAWLAVEAARGRMDVDAADSVYIEVVPSDARLECRVSLDSPSAWEIAARRGVIYALAALDPGERTFTRASNRWGDLEETWVREEGSWSARGAWLIGAPLPSIAAGSAPVAGAETSSPAAAATPPPGWLEAGLPQGTDVLLGRSRGAAHGAPVYVRFSGF